MYACCAALEPIEHRTLPHAQIGRPRHQTTEVAFRKPDSEDLHNPLNTIDTPLNQLGEKTLCPGNTALEKINASLR